MAGKKDPALIIILIMHKEDKPEDKPTSSKFPLLSHPG